VIPALRSVPRSATSRFRSRSASIPIPLSLRSRSASLLFTEARTDATANDSLQSVSVVGSREAHQELAAYTSFATTTDLKMMWTEALID